MPVAFETLRDFTNHGFDAVIDVRSPSEFAEDHVPGAINLPVLNDEERARVGTIYKQESPFKGRKIGAALVFRNASRHIEEVLQVYEGDWRPLVYCWRGGQRSGAFGWLLREIGWRSGVVDGGYKRYRRLVNKALYKDPVMHRLVLLDGQTGTAKTELLQRAGMRGLQVLDLEGAARHRGSLLGDGPDPQPSQKRFESLIACQLAQFDLQRPVLVEAESSKIGRLNVPPSLWNAMCAAPRIEVTAPLAERVGYLRRAYDDILSNPGKLRARLAHLRAVRGHVIVDEWMRFIDAEDKTGLTHSLIVDHYDPAYSSGRKKHNRPVQDRLALEGLNEAELNRGADHLVTLLAR